MVNQPGKEILFAHFAANLLKSGKLDEAIKVCENGLKKFPTYAQGHYILARCYIRKKLNDEARAELERVLRYDPNHIKAIRDLAGIYFTNGFQDLYKEYLMQLFTLDPVNNSVIEEAKKLGEYKLWSGETRPPVPTASPDRPEIKSEESTDKENVFIDLEKDKAEKDDSDTDSIFPDKIDLSQFDNVEDDFTTILHGKMEYSGKMSQPAQTTSQDLVDVAKNIIEEKDTDVKSDLEGAQTASQSSSDNLPTSKTKEENISVKPDQDSGSDVLDKTSQKNIETDGDVKPGSISDEISKGDHMDGEERLDSEDLVDEEDDKFEQPKIISQTLGEILVSQQKYVEAKAVFEALKEKQPDNKALDLKIEYLDRIIGLENEGKS
jgi:hypothetical protein